MKNHRLFFSENHRFSKNGNLVIVIVLVIVIGIEKSASAQIFRSSFVTRPLISVLCPMIGGTEGLTARRDSIC